MSICIRWFLWEGEHFLVTERAYRVTKAHLESLVHLKSVLVGMGTPDNGPQLSSAHIFDYSALVGVLHTLKYSFNVQITIDVH